MEKVSGMTLEQLVTMPQKRTAEYPTLTTQKIIEILEDKSLKEKLLRDLNTLHNSGIVHNDIHARNIILNSNGVVYLIDFGNSFSTLNLPAEISPDTIESKRN
jgi:serine/threonine protein kinase